jgi:hypothetical protein
MDRKEKESSHWDDIDWGAVRAAQDKLAGRDPWSEREYDDTSDADGEIASVEDLG